MLDQPVAPPEKLRQLKQLLDRSTDLELVARLVLGRYWRQATPEQQAEYVRLFKELVMQTMAERFSWYTGETFEITGAKPVDERDTMVATRILRRAGKPPIMVDWRVRQSADSFLLIDILAEGVSLVVTQRAEAADVIGREASMACWARCAPASPNARRRAEPRLDDASPCCREASQGARRDDDRGVFSGIAHALRTGCRRQDSPPVHGPPTTRNASGPRAAAGSGPPAWLGRRAWAGSRPPRRDRWHFAATGSWPDVKITLTRGWCWRTHRARAKPSTAPGICTSLNRMSTGTSARSTATASAAAVASITR